MLRIAMFILGALLSLAPAASRARQWTDSTGRYKIEATALAFNDDTVVLERSKKDLLAVPINKLSTRDRAYLLSKEAADDAHQGDVQKHIWTLRDGRKVLGKVIEYGRKTVTLSRRRGKIYLGDRMFDNLPEVYQRMVPQVVAHFEGKPIEGKQGVQDWLIKNRGGPKQFTLDGVVMEMENGDEYGVPFFFFSDADRKILEPGWQRWLAAETNHEEKQRQSFLVQAQAEAYQRDQQAQRQISMAQLDLLAYNSGLFSLWEVRMFPRPGTGGYPLNVVVPARNSQQAAYEATQRNPGYVAGPVLQVPRE
jgi:hypothetical protein